MKSIVEYMNVKSLLAGLFVISAVLLNGCAETPTQQMSGSEYSYSIILKGSSTNNAQNFFNGLKNDGGAKYIEVIELTDNYAECRALSQHDSGSMYSVITSVLEKQGQYSKVSYSAEKFIIRGS